MSFCDIWKFWANIVVCWTKWEKEEHNQEKLETTFSNQYYIFHREHVFVAASKTESDKKLTENENLHFCA